jgi:hypothetical protein
VSHNFPAEIALVRNGKSDRRKTMSFRRAYFLPLAFAIAAATQGGETIQTLNTPRSFPEISSLAEWRARSQVIRQQILVSAGLWPMPEKTPLNARVFGKIERDGYSVEKVYFQSYPGFYLAGNLYRPLGRGAGPFPAVLTAHGHWDHGRLEDTELCSNPGRCINFAKQGMIAFAFDMVGYNDTHFSDSSRAASFYNAHNAFASNDPVAMLWGVSLMGLQTWDSIRALDFLDSLPDVDTTRVAVTGESGGGTQTMILGAIDDRLAAQAPVVMVSHTMQGGCRCENMPGLRVLFSNMEIAAAAAPRPQILVSDTQDWTKTTMEMEGPAIGGIYGLFNATDKLRYVRYDFPHNYNQTSREAVYQWFDHCLLNKSDEPVPEQAFHKEADADLLVFPDGKLPPDAVSRGDLVNYIIALHRKELQAVFDRRLMMPAWQRTIQLDWPLDRDRVVVTSGAQRSDYAFDQLEIRRPGEDETIKVARYSPAKIRSADSPKVAILAQTDGADSFIDAAGAPIGLARRLLDQGIVVAVVPNSRGAADPNQTSLLFTTYNRTLLQRRVRDLVSICMGVKHIYSNKCRAVLCGRGAAGFSSMLTAPLADAVIADCGQVDTSDDQTFLAPELFCPGIRNIGAFEGALVLAAGNPLLLQNVANGFSTDHLMHGYRAQRAGKNLRIESRRLNDEEIASWVGALRFSAE